MEKQLINYLKSIDLSQTEAELFWVGRKSSMTVAQLVKATGFKPSTVYHAIETLRSKNLLKTTKEDGQLLITMQSTEQIDAYLANHMQKLGQKRLELEHFAHFFPNLDNEDPAFQVETYDTPAGVKSIIEKALNCQSGQWRIIAPRHNFFSDYDRDYADYFISKRRALNIHAKSLWERTGHTLKPRRLTLSDVVMRAPRYLPPEYHGKFKSIILIFDNHVAFISSLDQLHAVLIESNELSTTMGVMFDALWNVSEK